jgi:hypothetical protein
VDFQGAASFVSYGKEILFLGSIGVSSIEGKLTDGLTGIIHN